MAYKQGNAQISDSEFTRAYNRIALKYGANSEQANNYRNRWIRVGGPRDVPGGAPAVPAVAGTPGSPAPTPALDPAQQRDYNNEWGRIVGQGLDAETNLGIIQAGDAAVQAAIEENFTRGRLHTDESLAGRGLTSRGVNDAQLWDVNHTRNLAREQQAAVISQAQSVHNNIIRQVNTGLTGIGETRTFESLNNAFKADQAPRPPTLGSDGKPGTPAAAPVPAVAGPHTQPSGPSPGEGWKWSPEHSQWLPPHSALATGPTHAIPATAPNPAHFAPGPSPGPNYRWTGTRWVKRRLA
jgi:hypothetical protein